MKNFCQIAVNFPHRNSVLTYFFDSSKLNLCIGEIIKVPLGKRLEFGCVLELLEGHHQNLNLDEEKIKEIKDGSFTDIKLTTHQLELFSWMSKYYHYPLGKLIIDSMPKFMKRPKELQSWPGREEKKLPQLNEKQRQISQEILKNIDNGFNSYLLHGVTGSGKSLIYFDIVYNTILRGKSVLYILPEINLTPQFLEFFVSHLPKNIPVYIYNSELSDSDKFGLWKLLCKDSSPKVIIGVRSSIFLPIQNLGLIVVDEEHDSSLKQDSRCTYNARDVALKRSSMLKITIILGSATPSLETFYNFAIKDQGKNYLALKERANEAKLPEVILEDLKKAKDFDTYPLTPNIINEIKNVLKLGEQVLVLINRLGFSSFVQCKSCGHQFFCKNCSSVLRYFKAKNIISCSHCEYQIPLPEYCPECQCLDIKQVGFGTEKIAELLKDLLPNHTIARFDRDEIKNFSQLKKILDQFQAGEIDLLVGTQMLAKGHNFEKVNLVIVLGVDSLLNFSDFRSYEKAYQLISQVSGRSGRYTKKSKVIIPTLLNDNHIFQHIIKHNFSEFYFEELLTREELLFPPFARLALFEFVDKDLIKLKKNLKNIVEIINQLIREKFPSVLLSGPKPAIVEKKSNKFSWFILLKSKDINQLHNLVNTLTTLSSQRKIVKFKVDIDPIHLV